MPDRVADALAQRAGGGLDAGGVAVLGVARGLAAPGAQRLEVVELEAEPGQVELGVEGDAAVPGREHEPVATGPVGVGGVVPHRLLEQGVGHRGQAHRGAGVAVADLLHGVHREHARGVHRALVEVSPVELAHERSFLSHMSSASVGQVAAGPPRGVPGRGSAGRVPLRRMPNVTALSLLTPGEQWHTVPRPPRGGLRAAGH